MRDVAKMAHQTIFDNNSYRIPRDRIDPVKRVGMFSINTLMPSDAHIMINVASRLCEESVFIDIHYFQMA